MKHTWKENKARKVKDEHKIEFNKIKDISMTHAPDNLPTLGEANSSTSARKVI